MDYVIDLAESEELTWDIFSDFTQTLTKNIVNDLSDSDTIQFRYTSESTLLLVNGRWFMHAIHKFAKKHKFPLKNITFVGTNPKLPDTYNNWHRETCPEDDKINLGFECFGLRLYNPSHYVLFNDTVYTPTAPNKDLRPKKMNCLNANMLPHRLEFIQELFDRGCLDTENNLISVHHFFKHGQLSRDLEKLTPIQFDLEGGWDEVYNKIFEKDTSKTDWNKTGNFSNVYDNSYFTVTTESATCYSLCDYHEDESINDYLRPWYREIFATEKTFRPMLYWHPQLIYTSDGMLDWLKACGFKTFSNYWNEDYDNEPNGQVRKKMIVDEIKQLQNKPIEELHEMYWDMMPILEHNRHLILTNDFPRSPWHKTSRSRT